MEIKIEPEEYKIDIKTCYLHANNLEEVLLPDEHYNIKEEQLDSSVTADDS
ncbi:hypothetical protein ILUMI_07985, partial [Ignelater luminosus]